MQLAHPVRGICIWGDIPVVKKGLKIHSDHSPQQCCHFMTYFLQSPVVEYAPAHFPCRSVRSAQTTQAF